MNKRTILRDAINAIEDSIPTPLLPRGVAQNLEGILIALKHYTTGVYVTLLLELILGCALYIYVAHHTASFMLKCVALILIGIGLVIIESKFPHNMLAWTASMRHISQYLAHAKIILVETGCPQITLIGTWARTDNKTPDQFVTDIIAELHFDHPGEQRTRKLITARNYFFR